MAYIGIQVAASILATLWIMAVFPRNPTTGESVAVALLVKLDAGAEIFHAFLMETTLSFILIYVIFATAFDTVDTTNQVKVGDDKTTNGAGNKLTIYVRDTNNTRRLLEAPRPVSPQSQ